MFQSSTYCSELKLSAPIVCVFKDVLTEMSALQTDTEASDNNIYLNNPLRASGVSQFTVIRAQSDGGKPETSFRPVADEYSYASAVTATFLLPTATNKAAGWRFDMTGVPRPALVLLIPTFTAGAPVRLLH